MKPPALGDSRVLRGSLAATTSMIVLGSLFVSADAIEDYPIAAGQMLRCLGASALLALAARGLPAPTRREMKLLALLSVTGVVSYNVAILLAVRRADPAVVGVIISCLPVLTAAAVPLVQWRRPRPRVVVAALVVAGGAAVVQYSDGGATLSGVLLAVTALGFEVVFVLLSIPLLRRLPPIAIATYSCAFAVPLLFAIALATGELPDAARMSGSEALGLANLAFVVTPIAFVLWYAALRDLGVERAALFSGVLPLSVLATSAIFGDTPVDASRLAGALVVAAGITIGIRQPEMIRSTRDSRGP